MSSLLDRLMKSWETLEDQFEKNKISLNEGCDKVKAPIIGV